MIRDVPAYVHGLARNVLREALRERPPPPPPAAILWDSFDRCLAQLEPDRAEMLVAYYSAARRSNRSWRAELAASRSLSLNTAHRGRVAAPDGRDAFVSPWQPNRRETTLRVVVPSGALRDGRYVLVIEAQAATGEEPAESYAFRVRRR